MGYLTVGGGHRIHFEDWGNPDGQPIVFLHGGPGFGFHETDKNFFSADRHRVLFFDQRGAGKSLPLGGLEANTTVDIIQDILLLMDHVGMSEATMFGGSWGSSLAVLMAIMHPARVSDLVLRGFFPANNSCVMEMVSPSTVDRNKAEHSDFMAVSNAATRENFLKTYFEALSSDSEEKQRQASRKWSSYCAHLGGITLPEDAPIDLNHSILTVWYALNTFFLPDNYILENADKVSCTAYLVHGARDFLCPPKYALDLQRHMPQLSLEIVDAGHSSMEQEIFSRLKRHMLR